MNFFDSRSYWRGFQNYCLIIRFSSEQLIVTFFIVCSLFIRFIPPPPQKKITMFMKFVRFSAFYYWVTHCFFVSWKIFWNILSCRMNQSEDATHPQYACGMCLLIMRCLPQWVLSVLIRAYCMHVGQSLQTLNLLKRDFQFTD